MADRRVRTARPARPSGELVVDVASAQAAPKPAATTVRVLAATGAAAVAASVGLVVALPAGEPAPDVLHSMISDLVFAPDPGLFDLALVLLLGGALAVRAALARAGLLTGSRGLMAVFVAAIAAIAVFPTCHCQVQITASGVVHGVASAVAFTSLPLTALRLAARHRDTWRRTAAWARYGARACLCCFAPMGLAVLAVVRLVSVPVPFGLVQRVLGVLAMLLLLLLAGWAWTAATRSGGRQAP